MKLPQHVKIAAFLFNTYEEARAAAVVACENDWLESTALDAAIESTF